MQNRHTERPIFKPRTRIFMYALTIQRSDLRGFLALSKKPLFLKAPYGSLYLHIKLVVIVALLEAALNR